MKNIFNVIQLLNNLNYIKRTGPNLFAGISNEDIESIAAHSYKTTYLCLIFGNKIKNIDLKNLLIYAIVEDWAEAIIGDPPTSSRSYKGYFDIDIRKEIKKAESKARYEILEDAGLSEPKLTQKEKKLFLFCDILARTLELINHKQLGYKHKWIDKMFGVQIELLKEFEFIFTKDVVREVEELYKRGYMDNKYLTKAVS